MFTRKMAGSVVGALSCLLLAVTPAHASASDAGSVLTVKYADAANGSEAVLTVTFDKTLDPAKLARAQQSLEQQVAAPRVAPASQVAGPQGAYLYCNDSYKFGDADGTFYFQHACGGTTGPWGYKISSGVCAIAISNVTEAGMSWTRNGANQSRQAPHNVGCGYTFHGTYNPDHDYDFITYSDTLVFRIEVSGDTGTADLNIKGSFTSAGCPNGHACGM